MKMKARDNFKDIKKQALLCESFSILISQSFPFESRATEEEKRVARTRRSK